MLVQTYMSLLFTVFTLANAMMLVRRAPRAATLSGLRFTSGAMQRATHIGYDTINSPIFNACTNSNARAYSALAFVPYMAIGSSSDDEQVTLPTMVTTIEDYAEDWRNFSILWTAIKSVPQDANWSVNVEQLILRDRRLPMTIKMRLYKDFQNLSKKGPVAFINDFEDGLVYSYYSKSEGEKIVLMYAMPVTRHVIGKAYRFHGRQLKDVPLNDPAFISMFTSLIGGSDTSDMNIPTRAELEKTIASNPQLVENYSLTLIYKLHEQVEMFDRNTKAIRKLEKPVSLKDFLRIMQYKINHSKL